MVEAGRTMIAQGTFGEVVLSVLDTFPSISCQISVNLMQRYETQTNVDLKKFCDLKNLFFGPEGLPHLWIPCQDASQMRD